MVDTWVPCAQDFVNSSDTLPSFEEPQPIMPAEPLELHYPGAKLPKYIPNSTLHPRSVQAPQNFALFSFFAFPPLLC